MAIKYDNCKNCHSLCIHAGKDREFVCINGVSCKITMGKPQTNADRIRSMTDEELVVFLDGFSGRCLDCAEDAKNKSCQIYKEGHYCRPQDIMEWLQQPMKGE